VTDAGRRARLRAGLLALALAVQGGLPAQVRAAPAAAAAGAAQAGRGRAGTPHARRSGVEARVELLTRALGLDPGQQVATRKVLEDQQRQVLGIWNGGPVSAADRIAATRQVSLHTADRIRALLNEEQRKRYDPPPRGDPGKTVESANVEDWTGGVTRR
jgi:hypothetical protein